MKAELALATLGLPAHSSEIAIEAAFRKAMMRAHPDTNPEGSGEKVKAVKAARDYLLSLDKDGAEPCKLCGGSGYIQGFKCSSCLRKGLV